ncbi:MAG: Ni/Fe-hydrogenase cytochrome b subunit [Myxococcales bacterium]
MSHDTNARPVGGRILTVPMACLLAMFALACAVIGYRFVAGIGAVSNMNDGYTWGIWEPVNVVVFTGLGAGAFSVGALCYLLNRGSYHPMIRPAVLLGAIAYTLGAASIGVAVGRPWNIYWLALPSMWNLSSVLLEVAVCVITYVCVLWIEMLPAVLEAAAASGNLKRAERAKRWGGRLSKAMPYIIALALLLPTMHQSSLGGLMVIAGPKLHALWHTPLLPLLGLISCLSMGLGAAVLLGAALRRGWNARQDEQILTEMSKVNAILLLAYGIVRFADLAAAGKLHLLLVADYHLAVFVVEMALFLVPAVLFLTPAVKKHRVRVAGAAMAALAGALWRVDCFITCYSPGSNWHYFPSVGELTVTIGMAAFGVAVFIAMSKRFPVVEVQEPTTAVPASVAAFVLTFPQGNGAQPSATGTASTSGTGSPSPTGTQGA